MVLKVMVLAFCLAFAIVLDGDPQRSWAETSSEKEKKEEKKQKKEKKEKKEKKSNDKATGGGNPADGINKAFDGFKKGSGAAKDDAGKARNSVNDSYEKSKSR